jgi:Phospholipase_D-nuclease N-terminal
MSFWDFMWFIFVSYLFIAYLMVMFHVIGDIFRDRSTGGFAKAMWIVALIFVPVLTLLIYLIAKGRGMAERSMERAREMREAQEAYIRDVASAAPETHVSSPTEQVAQAKTLLDTGAISSAEYESLKAGALAGTSARS